MGWPLNEAGSDEFYLYIDRSDDCMAAVLTWLSHGEIPYNSPAPSPQLMYHRGNHVIRFDGNCALK